MSWGSLVSTMGDGKIVAIAATIASGADRAGPPGQCLQAGPVSCEDFGDVADLTQRDQAVFVEVAAVVPGECFCQYDRRDLRWPLTATAQLGQASALTGKCAQPPTVEDQRHALRRRLAEG